MADQPQPVFATSEERAVYQALKRFYKDHPKAIITRGQLRLEQVLGAKNRYQFPVVVDESSSTPARPSEVRLRRADAFHIESMAHFVTKAVDAEPAAAARLETFDNRLVFAGADGPAISAIMNGGLFDIEIDNVKFVQAWDVAGSRFVGEAIRGLESTTTAVKGTYPASAYERNKVFRPQVPVMRMNGGGSNELELYVNEPINATSPDAGTTNVIVWKFYGWKVLNGADYNPSKQM